MSLAISLRSEILKLKRTLSIYLCVLGAAFGPFMSFLDNMDPGPQTRTHQPWSVHFLQAHEIITGILLPLYMILTCTLLVQIEYRDKTWKQVLTSPQRLIDVFVAKFLSLQGMILLFILCEKVFLGITAAITEAMHPQLYDAPFNFYRIWAANMQSWLLLMGISAIQFWLSLRFRNFIAPLAIGVAGWFLGPMLVFQFKAGWAEYYPYAFTIYGAFPKLQKSTVDYQWYSVIAMLLFLTLAFAEFRARKVKG